MPDQLGLISGELFSSSTSCILYELILTVVVIILSSLILLGILSVIIIRTKMKDGTPLEIDYYAFFVVGISVLPLGIVLSIVVSPGFIGLAGLGLIDIIIGLSHREKWMRKRTE